MNQLKRLRMLLTKPTNTYEYLRILLQAVWWPPGDLTASNFILPLCLQPPSKSPHRRPCRSGVHKAGQLIRQLFTSRSGRTSREQIRPVDRHGPGRGGEGVGPGRSARGASQDGRLGGHSAASSWKQQVHGLKAATDDGNGL